jgi:hypothetical protein
MAPEVMRQEQFNEKADVYSFGLILYELISGEELFPQYEYLYSLFLDGLFCFCFFLGGGLGRIRVDLFKSIFHTSIEN